MWHGNGDFWKKIIYKEELIHSFLEQEEKEAEERKEGKRRIKLALILSRKVKERERFEKMGLGRHIKKSPWGWACPGMQCWISTLMIFFIS